MPASPHQLPYTGFPKLDNAAGRRPKTAMGYPALQNPTVSAPGYSWLALERRSEIPDRFPDIDEAYEYDTFAQQGVDKYVELCVKQGWDFSCKTAEPKEYLQRRFELMAIMSDTPHDILVVQLINDFVKYGTAFWVKKRDRLNVTVPGLPEQGVFGSRLPVLGYFRADPKRMRPVWSKDKKQILNWEFTPQHGPKITFQRQDVIVFRNNVQPSQVWGTPMLGPVLEDIRNYRMVEEYVIKLLYKHLNPLLHHEVPDVANSGQGRQEDVEAALVNHMVIAPDGMIVTPPNHKINMIGAESRALRGEGYLKQLRERVYGGTGVNAIVMGEGGTTSAGSADAMTITMHNRAKFFQKQLAAMLTLHVIYELLLEGGFDPTDRLDKVRWAFNEIETEALLARENHEIQKFTNGLTNEDEARHALGHEPFTDEEYERTHVHRVQIPLAQAQAEARAAMAIPSGPSDQVGNRSRPANQHGTRPAPKIKPR